MFIGVNIRNNPLNTLKWNTKIPMFKQKKLSGRKCDLIKHLVKKIKPVYDFLNILATEFYTITNLYWHVHVLAKEQSIKTKPNILSDIANRRLNHPKDIIPNLKWEVPCHQQFIILLILKVKHSEVDRYRIGIFFDYCGGAHNLG
jgi:hypothetical protein